MTGDLSAAMVGGIADPTDEGILGVTCEGEEEVLGRCELCEFADRGGGLEEVILVGMLATAPVPDGVVTGRCDVGCES
jgi:hypothetical protein